MVCPFSPSAAPPTVGAAVRGPPGADVPLRFPELRTGASGHGVLLGVVRLWSIVIGACACAGFVSGEVG